MLTTYNMLGAKSDRTTRLMEEVYGVWCMVFGIWCLVYGAWCMVHGVWCMVYVVKCELCVM